MSDSAEMIAAIQGMLDNEEQFNQVCDETFLEFDKDGSGELDKKEMQKCLENLAELANIPAPSSGDVEEVMAGLDTNNDSKVNSDEFKRLVYEVFNAILEGLQESG